jgi:hypothetical protein
MMLWRMSLVLTAGVVLTALAEGLNYSHVGVYAQDYEFCNMSVIKVRYFGASAQPERLETLRERLKANRAAGRVNLVGLYTIDRVKYKHPLETYINNTDAVLGALDPADVHCVFLSEENVTWNGGLAVLNGLYDHIKGRFPDLPVYQWLTSPDGPHPDLKADGWMYDHYNVGRLPFRRKVTEYVVTGKPFVMCLNASPMVALLGDPKGAAASQEQLDVCREFNIPTFYFCVDSKWGSPAIWWHSNDSEITAWRDWLLARVEDIRETDLTRLPLASADYTDADPIEAAPSARKMFEWTEDFGRASFLRRITTRGFTNLRWDGADRCLQVARRSAAFPTTDLFVQIVSEFPMADPAVEVDLAAATKPGAVKLQLSATGHNWPHEALHGDGDKTIAVRTGDDEAFADQKAFWIRITVDSSSVGEGEVAAVLDAIRFACAVKPPEKPGVDLVPDRGGKIAYEERFSSERFRWLAEIEGGDALSWQPGRVSTTGLPGRGNRVVLRWPLRSETPICGLRVELDCSGNRKNLGSHNTLGVSLDGEEVLMSASTASFEADRHGWEKGTLSLDLSTDERFSGATRLWVHATMINGCGKKTNPSNILTRLAVTAQVTEDTP